MKRLKITSVFLSVVMCASMVMTPVSVMADDTAAPEETQTEETTEKKETKETKETSKPTKKEAEKPEDSAPEETEKKTPEQTEKPEPEETEKTEPEETKEQKPSETEKEPEETKKTEPTETEPAETKEPSESKKTEPSESGKQEPGASESAESSETEPAATETVPEEVPGSTVSRRPANYKAEVAIEKNKDNTFFGTSRMAKPAKPAKLDSEWSGSFVYYGVFYAPMRYRVLSPSSTAYGTKALFLDSEEALINCAFDPESPITNKWADSKIKRVLNGSFLHADNFTEQERNAFATSVGTGGLSYADGTWEKECFGSPVSINDKVFILDISEVTNEAYGYSSDSGWTKKADGKWYYHNVRNRYKYGKSAQWALRSASVLSGHSTSAAYVDFDGYIKGDEVTSTRYWVAPAFNLDLDSILFSTAVSGEIGKVGTEYKLTIKDPKIKISCSPVTISGKTVTIPYQISGANKSIVNQVSVVIRKKTNWNILYYGALNELSSGTGAFTLPSNLSLDDWGASTENGYDVLILAEQVNKSQTTDYASEPVLIDKAAERNLTINTYVEKYDTSGSPYEDVNGESGTVSYSMTKVGKGDVVTVMATPKTGYVLKKIEVANLTKPGWIDITKKASFTVGDKNPLVYVQFQQLGPNETPKYKIHYSVMNEGGIDETGISGTVTCNVAEAKSGEKITVKATPAKGYVLYELGWTSGTRGSYKEITTSKTFTVEKADPYIYVLFVRESSPTLRKPITNTLTVKPKTAKVKYKKLKKKKQTVARYKVMTVSNPQGKVTYKLAGVKRGKSKKYKKYFKINASNGNVTVKKKLKKGTYKVTCNVTAAGNAKYTKVTKKVTFKIKVK